MTDCWGERVEEYFKVKVGIFVHQNPVVANITMVSYLKKTGIWQWTCVENSVNFFIIFNSVQIQKFCFWTVPVRMSIPWRILFFSGWQVLYSRSAFRTFDNETHNHTKENRQLRRQSSTESDDSEKKRLKTVSMFCQSNIGVPWYPRPLQGRYILFHTWNVLLPFFNYPKVINKLQCWLKWLFSSMDFREKLCISILLPLFYCMCVLHSIAY